MPQTGTPNYTHVQSRPVWSNGSDQSSFGSKRIKANQDLILAVDVNNLRDVVDVMFNHVHEYHDSVGSC